MKSKLLLIMSFVAVFTSSLFTLSAIPQNTAYAQNTAQATCSDPSKNGGHNLTPDRVEACVIGYNGGYDGKTTLETCGAPGREVGNLTYGSGGTAVVCTDLGHKLGVTARKATGTPPPAQDLNARAALACERFGTGDRFQSCVRGYKAASLTSATQESVSAECNRGRVNGETISEILKDDCRSGARFADKDILEVEEGGTATEAAGDLRSSARSSCKSTDYKEGAQFEACIKGYEGAVNGASKGELCDQYPEGSERRKACRVGFDRGQSGGGGTNNDNPNCDFQLTSPLSWIVCPVVDMGTAFTDWVYGTFVRGMLESVPISTDGDDPTFSVWKQFRLIGNILLVGTLLAIVYSQARGGGK